MSDVSMVHQHLIDSGVDTDAQVGYVGDMANDFIATNGVVIRPSGDGTLVDNVYLGDLHLDAIFQYATYLETEFPG